MITYCDSASNKTWLLSVVNSNKEEKECSDVPRNSSKKEASDKPSSMIHVMIAMLIKSKTICILIITSKHC